MPSILDILSREAETTFKFGPEEIWIKFDPRKHTPAVEAQLAVTEAGGQPTKAMAEMVVEMLIAWDLKGDVEFEFDEVDGDKIEIPGSGTIVEADSPFPIELPKVMYLPSEFLGEVLNAVAIEARRGREDPRNRASRRNHS